MTIWERRRADGAEGPVEVTLAREPIGLGKAMTLSVAVCTALERAAHAVLVERRAPVADQLEPARGAAREAAGVLLAS